MTKYQRTYLIKRLLYKSSYRGCKETDLILGRFAKKHIENLSDEELDAFDKILSLPDTMIWDILNETIEIPEDISKDLMDRIKLEKNI